MPLVWVRLMFWFCQAVVICELPSNRSVRIGLLGAVTLTTRPTWRVPAAFYMIRRKDWKPQHATIVFATGMQIATSGFHYYNHNLITEIRLTYSGGQFQPAQVSAPADKPITFRIKNADAKAMEFESKSLRVEKVVAANSEGVINVRALKPGRYEFYDDFNEKARGALIVQ